MAKESNQELVYGSIADCPHCGAKARNLNKRKGRGVYVYNDTPNGDCKPWPHVACLVCGSGSPSLTVWNRRPKKRA